jgi:hypothetical protein
LGIYRMYTGDDGQSYIESLEPSDLKLESLKKVSGCALQITQAGEFSDFHPAPQRRWLTILTGQIDIQLADDSIHSFGPEDLRLWEDLTGEGHRTRFPVPTVTVSMPVVD